MLLAIPEHQGRLAPVFDCCTKIVVIEHTPDGDQVLTEEDWSHMDRGARAARLRELNIDTLICGGISGWMEEQVRYLDINVRPWLSGDVEQILRAMREGALSDPCYAMPGSRRCCRRRQVKQSEEASSKGKGPHRGGRGARRGQSPKS